MDPEQYLIDLSEKVCQKLDSHGKDGVPESVLVFATIWELEAEVNNGGFSQYYYNSAGDYATEVVDALKLIGAARMADIVHRANEKFPGSSPPKDREKRQAILDEIETDETFFGSLDDEFYEYPDDLSDLLFKYVQTIGELGA